MRLHALCLMVAAGCVSDEPVVGEQTSEIVGGALTTARPEIGQYITNTMSCTATLVGPSLVITAAHCLTPAYTATTPPAGSRFFFHDARGLEHSVGVDRVHSFATRRFERILAGSRFTTDVALLHLVTPVPSEWAVPAEIAIQEPATGAASSVYGFGCTARDPRADDVQKRIFAFAFGDTTRAVCWGDSGGPAVFGTAGAIWGITSDFDFNAPNTTTNTWPDVWADVPFYKKQIEAVARGWESGVEPGWDRAGHDYLNYVTSSLEACKSDCETDGNCRAFTFRPSDRMCWRKNAAAEPIVNPLTITGLPSTKQAGVDRYGGGDFAQFFAGNIDVCAATCARTSGCASWNFNNNQCWLKSQVPAAVPCATCTSGVVRRGQELGYERPGSNFESLAASSVEECATRCARDSRCESYSMFNTVCSLKNSVPAAVAKSSPLPIGSGVRRGLELDSDRPGLTYALVPTLELTPFACQAMCARDASCQAWSYQPPTAPNTDATCFLKNGVPSRVTTQGMISGLKGSEMLP